MKKLPLILGGLLAAAIFIYGSLAALVNQGLPLPAAVIMLVIVVGGGAAMIRYLR